MTGVQTCALPIWLLLTHVNFDIIWRYFAWSNQTLATVVLWTITVYLATQKKNYWITLLPALFMTMVVTVYLMLAPEGLRLSKEVSYSVGALITILSALGFFVFIRKK